MKRSKRSQLSDSSSISFARFLGDFAMSPQSITFEMRAENITPQLLINIGLITLNWAMIDNQITDILDHFWLEKHPQEKMPRAFDKRIEHLQECATDLYGKRDPGELRIFKWYAQRLKDANGLRDCIAHGMPGKITKPGATFEGLMVPKPSHPTKYIPMTPNAIAQLTVRLRELLGNYPVDVP
jgi:hypothetical protein